MKTPTYQGKVALITVARLQFSPIKANSGMYIDYLDAFHDRLKEDKIDFTGITYVLDDCDMCVGLYAYKRTAQLTRID